VAPGRKVERANEINSSIVFSPIMLVGFESKVLSLMEDDC
jgi:hypothetical protein